MDDSKTKIEPLTPDQSAWYAEQEAKYRKEMKKSKMGIIVFLIFCVVIGILGYLLLWKGGFFDFGPDRIQERTNAVLKTYYVVIGVLCGPAIIGIIALGFCHYAAEKKLEKLQHQRLFREK